MTTKNSKTGSKAKKAVATSTKVTSGAKRAVQRERVQMVKPSPSAPMPAPVFDAPAPVAETMETGMSGEMKTTPVAMKSVSSDLNGAMATTPSSPQPVLSSVASGAMQPLSMSETATASEPERRIGRADFELMVRRTAYRLAQRRQFRGGSPSQDWFAAEAAVKADLQSRGISLAN